MRSVSESLAGRASYLGRDVGMPQPTVRRYLNLLETSYLLVRLPAYSVNRTKRLIKSPKTYWTDSGVALHLAQGVSPSGVHLENLVLNELLVWRDAREEHAELFYWRTTTGEEGDLVIEAGGKILPIEIKASAKPTPADTRFKFRFGWAQQTFLSANVHTPTRSDYDSDLDFDGEGGLPVISSPSTAETMSGAT